ncbi:Aste57867_19639 [Aphanomyces stellatus]|uniref:Aste57867_19639 protein n=1 Tax=Aphanomyces stellatus TaxID=120398 RepID=A0A485LE97_9STRA|nr:hypothetical protein As57867_019574 [Aphanomyces stellatus]VFT96339.1 Aste57867_19639 [Aphanomyces stellatus]
MDDDYEGGLPVEQNAQRDELQANMQDVHTLEVRVFELVTDLVSDGENNPYADGRVQDEQVTIRNMNWLSNTLEQAEAYFRQTMSTSRRDGHLIGHLLRILDDFEDFYSMLERKLHAESAERANNEAMNAAVCRLLLATSPTNARFIVQVLYEEEVLERVTGWANTQSTDLHAMQLQTYASGLLSVGLRDRSIADIVVNHETFSMTLLRRARYYADTLEDEHHAAMDYMLDVQKRTVSSKHKKQLSTPSKKRKLSVEEKKDSDVKPTTAAASPTKESAGKVPGQAADIDSDDDDAAAGASKDATDSRDLGTRLGQLVTGDAVPGNHDQVPKHLVLMDLIYTLECIGLMGEYLELLASALKEDIVGTALTFLHTTHVSVWSATLKLISHFLAHKKFAFSFLDAGGLELILAAHGSPHFSLLHRSLSMCLHGFASSSVVTEIILSREANRAALLAMALTLLSSPHDRARQNAVVFFGLVVPFRSALEYFETHDGVYTLLNLIRAGNTPKGAIQRQLAHDACLCLRQYVRVHFGLLAHALRRRVDPPSTNRTKWSVWKPVDIDDKAHDQHIHLFEQHRPPPRESKWQSQFSHLRGPLVLLEVLDVFHSHSIDDQSPTEPTSYRLWLVERAQFCLQILRMLTLAYSPMALEICSTARQDTSQRTGLTILLDCAMTSHPRDGDIVKGALQVFCNCVVVVSDKKPTGGGATKDNNDPAKATHLRAILKLAREKNAIKVCLQLLRYKRSLQQADAIRLLATQALLGLSKDRHMTQILEQMQIGQLLSDLIRNEPVLEENADLHAKFRACALDLISHVTHRAPSTTIHEATDPTVRKIEKANIVAATRVTYNPNELLLMIHDHLKAHGLSRAADALEAEAALKVPPTCLSPQKPKKTKSTSDADESAAKRARTTMTAETSKATTKTPLLSYVQRRHRVQTLWKQPSYFDKADKEAASATAAALVLSPKKKKPVKTTWLDTVVRQHLREQHRLCAHPVSVVPPFSLASTTPHRCPDVSLPPLYANVCGRLFSRGVGGLGTDMHVTRFVSSRHRPYRIVGHHNSQAQGGLTAARFMTSLDRHILLGTDHGELMQINMDQDEIVGLWSCHPNAGALTDITTNESTRMAFSHAKPLLLTGTSRITQYVQPRVGLWDMGAMNEPKWVLPNMRSPRFNFNGDRVVAMACHDVDPLDTGAAAAAAVRGTAIYDVETGTLLSQLRDELRTEAGNTYGDNSNCAFAPSDTTLLADGLLWDVRTSKMLHKFDKLSNFGYGFYNPSGNEVIINSAVWDLRTFKLLRVVPALENCKIQFCATRPVMYVYSPFEPMGPKDTSKKLSKHRTWFRVLDTRDYKDVSTVDIERPIYDVSLNTNETTLAIVEGRYLDSIYGQDDPVCRLYEIGRDKPNECDSDLEDTLEDDGSESMSEFESASSVQDHSGESSGSGSESGSSGDDDDDDDDLSGDEFDTDTDYEGVGGDDDDDGDDHFAAVQWALADGGYLEDEYSNEEDDGTEEE